VYQQVFVSAGVLACREFGGELYELGSYTPPAYAAAVQVTTVIDP
jgi:hypothetical protein